MAHLFGKPKQVGFLFFLSCVMILVVKIPCSFTKEAGADPAVYANRKNAFFMLFFLFFLYYYKNQVVLATCPPVSYYICLFVAGTYEK